jgi:adenosylmethionine-8-amino-7-oxononanoate aminotransferase
MPEHRYPAGNVLYRKLTKSYPLIVKGEGCWLWDEDGRRYLDACGGAFVANLGHGLSVVGDAMAEQARRVAYVNGTAFTHQASEDFAAALAARLPAGLRRVYPLGSGSEAVEAALKCVRQYWAERGRPSKQRLIALTPSYHGNTLLALSASAREHYRRVYAGWLVDVARVPAPYFYRCECRGTEPYCEACSGAALERTIAELGPDNVAGFIAEPVGGSSTGAAVPPPDYFRRVRAICDRYEVLFVADEVASGAGRTGTFTAIEQFGVTPDLMALGKGIGGGYVPISAMVATDRVAEVLAEGSGGLLHAQTFSHNPVLCAGGAAALRYLGDHRLVERSAEMGRVLHRALSELRALPHVGDVRGRGLFAGIEFVADTVTRAPFARTEGFAEAFVASALQEGLVVWPNVGHADGVNGDLVMIAPPFVITEVEIGEIVARFARAMTRTLAGRGSGAAAV